MKQFICSIIICFAGLSLQAQDKPIVTLKNDTAYLDGKAQFVAKSKSIPARKGELLVGTFSSLDGKTQVMITMKISSDTTIFGAKFVSLNLSYECLYPKVSLFTIVESYLVNKILVNGVVSKEGLEAYCKSRNVTLHDAKNNPLARKPGGDAKRDSMLTARAKERMDKQFKLLVTNNSKSKVNIFLGDTTASRKNMKPNDVPFRQGRYEMIDKGDHKELTVFTGEFICISDSLHKLYDVRSLNKNMKPLVVKKNGLRFD